MTMNQIRLAWKYRRLLWKLRGAYRHRKEIASIALTGVMLGSAAAGQHRAKYK